MNSSLHSMPEVRESAGLAFKIAGMQAIDEIVPTLLHALEDDETSDTALDGLKQILSVRTTVVLPHILPKLVHLPLSAFNAHALGALAEVAGPGLNFHLGAILPALLSAMGAEDKDVQTLAKEVAETVALVIDEEGVEYLIAELLKGVGDTLASIRRSSSYLIGFFFKYSKLYLVDEAPNMISTLIILLSDSDSSTVEVAWEALSRVIGSVPKEGGPVVIPGFCLPKALQPLLPIFLQGLTSGSAELREQAALGLGELIEVTSEKALKDFVIPITGNASYPDHRQPVSLAGEECHLVYIKHLNTEGWDVPEAFSSSASNNIYQASDAGVREAILTALKGVLKHAGKSVSDPVRVRVFSQLKDLIHHDDDQPGNVLFDEFGIAKVTDFDLSKIVEEDVGS
ncbi:hypothetical protein NC651_039871 [Populus alba x Populus x berolinensis]|nr:hypothetical protein NC651_039871 [Populus alba x Populus x berolinensis]